MTKTNIPCLFLPYYAGSNKVLIYFHANAEDVGLTYQFLDQIRTAAKINVIAPEYPGYGIYNKINMKKEQKDLYCSAE